MSHDKFLIKNEILKQIHKDEGGREREREYGVLDVKRMYGNMNKSIHRTMAIYHSDTEKSRLLVLLRIFCMFFFLSVTGEV